MGEPQPGAETAAEVTTAPAAVRRATLELAVAETLVWAGIYYQFPALLLRFEAELGWSRASLSLAFTLAVATSALAAPFAGRLVDRGHGRWLLAGGALAGGLLLALLSSVTQWAAFVAVWMAIGLAMAGCLYEPCFAVVTRALGGGARGAITRITLCAGFASTLSFPSAALLADAGGWRASVLVWALVLVLVAAPLFWHAGGVLAARNAELKTPAPDSPRPRRVSARAGFWRLAAAFSLLALNHGILVNHLLPLLAERGVAVSVATLAVSMIGPMQVLGRLTAMSVERRASAVTVMFGCFAGVSLAGVFLLWPSGGAVGLVAFVVLQGAAYGVLSMTKPPVTAELMGRADFGAVAGLLAVPYLAAFAAAPFVGAVLWRLGGYPLVLAVVVTLAMSGLLCFRSAVRAVR